MIFEEKYLSRYISFLEILGNMCVVTACYSVYDVKSFEINLNLSIR